MACRLPLGAAVAQSAVHHGLVQPKRLDRHAAAERQLQGHHGAVRVATQVQFFDAGRQLAQHRVDLVVEADDLAARQ